MAVRLRSACSKKKEEMKKKKKKEKEKGKKKNWVGVSFNGPEYFELCLRRAHSER
jgi:hypothetical protein